MNINKKSLRLYASAKAVITQFLTLPGTSRVEHVILRLEMLNEKEVADLIDKIMKEFGGRHRNIKQIFLISCQSCGSTIWKKPFPYVT